MRARHACIAMLVFTVPVLGNGGRSKKIFYEAQVEYSDDICRFSAEVEPTLFRLMSLNGKYKVVQIKINNRGSKPLALSRTQDSIRVQFRDSELAGIFDLFTHDAETWDALDLELREELAYPTAIPPGEERNVYVFIAKPDLRDVPRMMVYRLESLSGEEIRLRDTTAKRAVRFRPVLVPRNAVSEGSPHDLQTLGNAR